MTMLGTRAEVIDTSAFDVLPPADIILLGELHDHREHHDNQARAVAAIKPSALVFEMLSAQQAREAIGIARDDMAALEAALGWQESGWPDFEMYFPIFVASEGAAIYGAALPRDVMRAAISDGAAQHFTGDAALFGLDQPLAPSEQQQREALQAGAHCNALPAEMLPGMVEAQRLRDASFAKVALEALRETGGPVVVITGNGHARKDWGMPRYLQRAAPDVSVLSVGQVTGEIDTAPYDLWAVTEPVVRDGDPCDAFKTN